MEELDATLRPTLHQGDLLLLAATTIVSRLSRAEQQGEEVSRRASIPRVLELVLSDARLTAPARVRCFGLRFGTAHPLRNFSRLLVSLTPIRDDAGVPTAGRVAGT
eukprot:SAG31_NODE_1490_length_8134_cov_3.892968_6_plen_106_part_00